MGLLVGGAGWSMAQTSENPPVIVGLTLSTTPRPTPTPWTYGVSPCLKEGDSLYVYLRVQDLDFNTGDQTDQGQTQIILVTMESTWIPYIWNGNLYGPQPPLVETDRDGGALAGEPYYTGFAPAAGNISDIWLEFVVPEFNGANQARLQGLIDYDVLWSVRITVRNEESSGQNFEPDTRYFDVCALENPALKPGNPPPFADAGADQDLALDAATGTAVVTLDGSRTYDASNIGFDVLDPNVIYKDILNYTWEWISGPVQVAADKIVIDATNPARSKVTLQFPGEYAFRLLVDDGANSPPSTDTVQINLRSTQPVNNAPIAVVAGPTDVVPRGAVVQLNGQGSSDPDGDQLTYHWRQTNEVGGELSADQIRTGFQPLDGADSAVCSWRATAEGTYYFRLLVTDLPERRDSILNGQQLTDTASLSVQVVGSSATSAQASARNTPAADGSSEDALPLGPTGCGGGLASLSVLPVLLWLARGRRR